MELNIMKLCHKCMLIMGICASVDQNKWTIAGGYIRSGSVVTAITLCVFQPCTRYFLQHISNLLDATGVALMWSIGFFGANGLIAFTIRQKEILQVMLDVQSMSQKCNSNNNI